MLCIEAVRVVPLGLRRAVSHIAQFQKNGAVPKRAETLGTRRLTWQDSVSGRLYRKHWRLPIPTPKSTVRGSVIGGTTTCTVVGQDCLVKLGRCCTREFGAAHASLRVAPFRLL